MRVSYMVSKKIKVTPHWKHGIARGYRSGLESKIGEQLKSAGVEWYYEPERIPYIPNQKTYTPDFYLPHKDDVLSKTNRYGIFIETKGRFLASDRAKHLLIKEQHPDLDIRFVFTNPNQKLYKGSRTTYGQWCNKYGFKYAKKDIPSEWIIEVGGK